jgi:hypothetical protein
MHAPTAGSRLSSGSSGWCALWQGEVASEGSSNAVMAACVDAAHSENRGERMRMEEGDKGGCRFE